MFAHFFSLAAFFLRDVAMDTDGKCMQKIRFMTALLEVSRNMHAPYVANNIVDQGLEKSSFHIKQIVSCPPVPEKISRFLYEVGQELIVFSKIYP